MVQGGRSKGVRGLGGLGEQAGQIDEVRGVTAGQRWSAGEGEQPAADTREVIVEGGPSTCGARIGGRRVEACLQTVRVGDEHLPHGGNQFVILDIVGNVPDQIDCAQRREPDLVPRGLELLEFMQRQDLRGEELLTLDHCRTPPEKRRHEARGKREELIRRLDVQANRLEGPYGGDDVVADCHGLLAVGNVGHVEGEGQGIGPRIEVEFLLGGRGIRGVNEATC